MDIAYCMSMVLRLQKVLFIVVYGNVKGLVEVIYRWSEYRCFGNCYVYYERGYFPLHSNDVVEECLVFTNFLHCCFCRKSILTLCEFKELDCDADVDIVVVDVGMIILDLNRAFSILFKKD